MPIQLTEENGGKLLVDHTDAVDARKWLDEASAN